MSDFQPNWKYVIAPVLGHNHKKEWNLMTRRDDGAWLSTIGTFSSVRAAREAIAHLSVALSIFLCRRK